MRHAWVTDRNSRALAHPEFCYNVQVMKSYLLAVLVLLTVSAASAADDFASRLHASAYADIESAYWARGVIVDKHPYSAQYADLSCELDPFGKIGGYAWSVSALAREARSRRFARN